MKCLRTLIATLAVLALFTGVVSAETKKVEVTGYRERILLDKNFSGENIEGLNTITWGVEGLPTQEIDWHGNHAEVSNLWAETFHYSPVGIDIEVSGGITRVEPVENDWLRASWLITPTVHMYANCSMITFIRDHVVPGEVVHGTPEYPKDLLSWVPCATADTECRCAHVKRAPKAPTFQAHFPPGVFLETQLTHLGQGWYAYPNCLIYIPLVLK